MKSRPKTSDESQFNCLFFAKLPPPHTGMTIATETFSGLLEGEMNVDHVDTSYGRICPAEVSIEWVWYHALFAGQLLKAYTSLWHRLRKNEYDVFYFVASPSVLGHWKNRVALEIARHYVSRIVGHVHNGNFQDVFEQTGSSWSAHRMVEVVDTFVFTSRMLAERTEGHIPVSKRRVVPNTIDEQVRCTEAEVAAKIEDRSTRESLRVLYLSNMIETKGYSDVAEAVELFNSNGVAEATVDFVGDWPSTRARSRFEKQRTRYRHADAMHVHGAVTDRTRVREMMLRSDVFVLPTYYPNEAQPITLIEVMNAATPVIATEHASIPEYVFDDENGYLINKKAPSQIADCLKSLSDRSNWVQKARAARETYQERFSPSTVRERMLDVLRGRS